MSPSQLCLLAGPSLGSPVSVPAASPEAQPVADPEADAHYGHYGDKFTFTCAALQKLLNIGYGRSVVLPTLWGASYGHHYYGKR